MVRTGFARVSDTKTKYPNFFTNTKYPKVLVCGDGLGFSLLDRYSRQLFLLSGKKRTGNIIP